MSTDTSTNTSSPILSPVPIFSLCHATARPSQWKLSYDAWWTSCDHPETIEYILAVDERWGFTPKSPPATNDRTRLLWCNGKRGSTTAWNSAAAASTGQVLIMVADDILPPPHWDTELLKVIPNLDSEFVLEVSSAKLPDAARLMVAYLLSRKRYDSLGYVINPQYIGIYADNEFGDHARQDNVVIDARHLQFRHYHPYYHDELFPQDAVYASGNTHAAVVQGLALYTQRKALGFPRIPKPPSPPRVSVITPTIPEREKFLSEARESVARQTHPNTDHIVGVDTSHIGQGFLRNELARKSTAEWLVFLDDDDLLDPEFIELHLAHAQATHSDLVYSVCRLPSKYRGWAPRAAEFDEALLRLPTGNYIPVTVLVRRELFNQVGGFKVSGSLDDWNLWLDLLNIGAKFSYLPCVLWSYRVHGMRMTDEMPKPKRTG